MKNPPPPPGLRLGARDLHVHPVASPLFRIVFDDSEFPLPFGRLREYGPIADMRFDPHPAGPAQRHPHHGVLYAATNLRTALAEVFQADAAHDRADRPRIIDRLDGGPRLWVWRPTRPLRLVDLDGFALRNGASGSLFADAKARCREWAAAVHALGGSDGLRVRSTMTGEHSVVLFGPAADAFPVAPEVSIAPADPALGPRLRAAARTIGYLVV